MKRLFALLPVLALTSCTFQPGVSLDTIPQADVEACEHMNNGTAITVKGFGSETPATVDKPHQRYEIQLEAQDGRYTGKVLYNNSEDADYVLFFDQDVPLAIQDDHGHAIDFTSRASASVACSSVKARYGVHLEAGPHTLVLGPTAAATVSLIIEESAHTGSKEEHEHDHAH